MNYLEFHDEEERFVKKELRERFALYANVPFGMFCRMAMHMPGLSNFRLYGIVPFAKAVGGDVGLAESIQRLQIELTPVPEPDTP